MMNKSKKSQFAIEFVILITFMLVIFLGFFAIVSYRLIEVEENEKQQTAENIAALVENEIRLAKSVNNGYERTFKIPNAINGNAYSIGIIENRELVVDYLDYEHVSFLPENVRGNVSPGLVNIKKMNDIVYLQSVDKPQCTNTIDDDYDTLTDSGDPGCYKDCDYMAPSKFMYNWFEADNCDCSSIGVCCSGMALGNHYTLFDESCGAGECWSMCLLPENLLLRMRNSLLNIISFDISGNVILRGTLYKNTAPQPTEDDEFIVKDSSGDNVAVVNLVTGSMVIKGDLFENQPSLTPSSDNDFIVKDSNGIVVSYIGESGNFYLKGTLTENGNP